MKTRRLLPALASLATTLCLLAVGAERSGLLPHLRILPGPPGFSTLKDLAMKKASEPVLDRMTSAKLGPEFNLALDRIKQRPSRYRHRDAADLDPKKEAMQALEKSLITEGQREPVLVIRIVPLGGIVPPDGVDEFEQITAHRRVAALRHLAETNVPGFTLDMLVRVREILDGTPQDHLLWSVADNVLRESLDEIHRLKATIMLINSGVDHARIKANLKLSDSTFERYRRLALSPWMLDHVEKNEIGLTDAHQLLEAAGGNGGALALEHLLKDLARLVAVAKTKIQDKREELAERHKELKGSEAMVKSYFPAHLVKKWVLDLKQGRRIQGRAKFVYGATIETDKIGKKLIIPAVSLYLVEQNLEPLAEVIVRLDRTLKDAKPQVNALARQRLRSWIIRKTTARPTSRLPAWMPWPRSSALVRLRCTLKTRSRPRTGRLRSGK